MAETARRHLERLAAAPRPAGSAAEAAARQYCTGVLQQLGFSVFEEPFEYSTAPGRWATPAAGAAALGVFALAGHLGNGGDGRGALLVIVVSVLLGVPAALWMSRRGVLDVPFGRATGINLRATKGGPVPAVWLVAHLDTKSQPIPTAVRAAAIVATGIVLVVALVVAVMQASGADVAAWWIWITIAGAVVVIPIEASIVGDHSPGALDNASGVATVLEAITLLDADPRAGARGGVGVLLTSAEELGLAGARAVARRHPRAIAINCDGVDDRGTLICMRSGGRGGRSVAALEAAAKELGIALAVRGLIPGLLVDAVALHDAGWDAATLSRGSWSSLARVHRPHDDLGHLSGAGVPEAAAVMAAAATRLISD